MVDLMHCSHSVNKHMIIKSLVFLTFNAFDENKSDIIFTCYLF